MTLDSANPDSRLDLHFGVPPTNQEWVDGTRLALVHTQRAAAPALVAHLEKNGVPVAQLALGAPWPKGPSDDCLREILWSLGTLADTPLQDLAKQHGTTLARLSAAPRDVLEALINGLADARQCLPLSLSELRLLPQHLSAPCVADTKASSHIQGNMRVFLGMILKHSDVSECGEAGVWGEIYTGGVETIRGKYPPRDPYAAALFQAYQQSDPRPEGKQLSSAQALLAKLDEWISPVDASLLRHMRGTEQTLVKAQLVELGLGAGPQNALRAPRGFVTWMGDNAAAFTKTYDLGKPGVIPSTPVTAVQVQVAHPTSEYQPSNSVLYAALEAGVKRLTVLANAVAPEGGPRTALTTWNLRASSYGGFLKEYERRPFEVTLPAGLSPAARTRTEALLAAHATAANQAHGDPETLTRFRQLPGTVQDAIVKPLALRDKTLRSVLNPLHGLDLFGGAVPKTYAPRLQGHTQILNRCKNQSLAVLPMGQIRTLLRYTEQRWEGESGESLVIEALKAASFQEFKTQLGDYPGAVTDLKSVYDTCHTDSFVSATDPRLTRNVQRLAEIEDVLESMPATERVGARDMVVGWIKLEEDKMPNTSYDRVGQALELVDVNAFCDSVQAQLKVTLTPTQRTALTALHDRHDLTYMDDFIDWGEEE